MSKFKNYYSRLDGVSVFMVIIGFLLISCQGDFSRDTSGSLEQKESLMSLDGEWKFALDSTPEGVNHDWSGGIPESLSQPVYVPHTWNIMDGAEEYAGKAWYQRSLIIPHQWADKQLRLRFEAVYHDAHVYINGVLAGEHRNAGNTPFSVDITNLVTPDMENKLVVLVNNAYSATNLPYQRAFDWTNDGGIIRSVSLKSSGDASLRYVHVEPKVDLKDSTANLRLSIRLWEKTLENATFKFSIIDSSNGELSFSDQVDLKAEHGNFHHEIPLQQVKLWHFDAPNLYKIKTEVLKSDQVSDAQEDVFGFRDIKIVGNQFYLNGEEVRLPGIEYMPGSNPKYGVAESRTYMDSVVRAMKDLNITITRFHWQQDDYMLQLMDKYGILVQEELPWWQQPARLSPELQKTARRQLDEMLEAHYNHPSVFSWGISNEVNGDTDKELYKTLRDFINEVDSTRIVNIVSNRIWQKEDKDETLLGDMPSWNEYIGTWHGNDRNELPSKMETVKNAIGGRPLLITENGLCEPANAGGDMRRIDDMLFHINAWSAQPYILGYIYFCLTDYRTQMGEEGTGKYQIRRHGVTDVALNPKPSYYVLKQLASPIDITNVGRIDGTTALVEIRVKEQIPSYTLRNYRLIYMTNDNIEQIIDLPDLEPGEEYQTELTDVNPRFAFKILRPGNFVVIEY